MFSLDKFYDILHDNLVSKLVNSQSVYFYPFGTYNNVTCIKSANLMKPGFETSNRAFAHCYFFDQEPYYDYSLEIFRKTFLYYGMNTDNPTRFSILANSEISDVKQNFIRSDKTETIYDWYYFFHGFAALDWYRSAQYMNPSSFDRFDKVFICYNHLISKNRAYRLHLVSNLISDNLVQYGAVSLFLKDSIGTWQDVLVDHEVPLDNRARVKINSILSTVSEPLIIDTAAPTGALSAELCLPDLTSALWHVVTETVYFLPKLHLTEKVFKPIVSRRPFILVAAPGNLAYLKSYGFRTFDQWIDESYDLEQDHYVRIEKITAEIKRLCALSRADLEHMHREMQEVLEHNFNHFYNQFKITIVNELVDNFAGITTQINNGRLPGNHSRYHSRIEISDQYLAEVKKRLCQ